MLLRFLGAHVLLAVLVLALASCSDGGAAANGGVSPFRITFPGVGTGGVFDAAPTRDPAAARIWMSYSAVDPSVLWPAQNGVAVSTRLAFSDDAGGSWSDAGLMNPFQDVTVALAPPNDAGTWLNEVSRLVYDPGAAAGESWKLLWHHYLEINGGRNFEHGWIGYKAAATPAGLSAATEVKLFSAVGYNTANDTGGGPTQSPVPTAPAVAFATLHANLAGCIVISEPGLLAKPTALYLSMLCAEASGNGRIVLLRCDSPCDLTQSSSWAYLGTIFQNADAVAVGYLKFSATELFTANGTDYLVVTPVNDTPVPDAYHGCRVYAFADIDTAALAGPPTLVTSVSGTAGSFNGACGYESSMAGSGMIYGEVHDLGLPSMEFRLYASRNAP